MPYSPSRTSSTFSNRLPWLSATLFLCCVAPSLFATDINNNLLLYFKLDETSGSVATDSGPNAQNGTYATNATPGIDVAGFTSTTAKFGTAVNFNNGFHINLSQAASNLTNGLSQVTICAWVNMNAVATGERCIIEFKSSTGNTRLSMRLNSSKLEVGARAVTGDGNHLTTGATVIPPNTYAHLAMTVDYRTGQQALLGYLNGAVEVTNVSGWGANTAIEATNATQPATIGGQPNGALNTTPLLLCNDIIDDLRIYSRVLTQSEIQAAMNFRSNWSGAGGVSNWTTAGNWDVLPNPSNGLALNFPGSTQINANNDFASAPFEVNQILHSNTFSGTNTISGNQLRILGPGAAISQTGSAALNLSAPLDFAGNTTINVTGSALTLSNQLTNSGTLSLTGTGSVIVNNTQTASTNSGLITVAGPTLEVDSALGTSGVTLTSGILKGTNGNIGGTVTVNGGIINPGLNSGNISTLTMGGLVLNGGGAVTFDLNDTPAGPNNDNIVVTGALTSGGTFNFNLGPGFTNQSGFPKTYTLITAGSPPTGALPLIGSIVGGAFHVNKTTFVGNTLQVEFGTGAASTATWSTNATPANWNTGGNWASGVVPTSGVATALIFPTLGFVNPYAANNDIPTTPFVLNLLTLNSNTNGNAITGGALQFDGGAPAIQQSGTGSFAIQTPISLNTDLTILGAGNGALTLSGPISGSGGIANSNSGVALTLNNSAGNTYTGNTAINNGSLAIANTSGSATGTGNVTFNASTSLSGAGSIAGSVTFNGATTLAPGIGAGAIGTLATGPLTLNANTSVNLDLAAPGTNDKIIVTGAATFAGGLNITNSGGNLAAGDYTLFTYTGAATDLGFSLFAPVAFAYKLPTAGGVVKLTVIAPGGPSTWAATGTANFARPINWDVMPGSADTTTLSFPALASAYIANNNLTGLTLNGITIGSTGNSITGNAIGLQGTAPFITQTGAGPTTISSPLALNANTVVTASAGSTLTLGGTISGTGGLSVTGPGTVLVTNGTNSFAGPTSVSGNAVLILQNTTGTSGIPNSNGALGATNGISISGAELQINTPTVITNLDRPITFGNGGILNVIPATNGNFNTAGAWTINAVDATPAVVRYRSTSAFTNYFGVPALTATPANTLRLEINNGVTGAAGLGGIMDFGPGLASTINCKVIFSGVNGGSAAALAGSTNVGKFYLNNGPYIQAAGTPGLFFENAVQIVSGNGARVLNTDMTVSNGILAIQGRGTGTNFEAGTHDTIIGPGKTVTVKSGAKLNLDLDFRGDQNNTGGVLLLANTVLEDNATLTFLNSGTRLPSTHPYRTHVVGGSITGSGPNSVLVMNDDAHDGAYNTINSIVTDGTTATVTTDNPHKFNSGDFVCITHSETELGTGGTPVPALPVATTVAPIYGPVAGSFNVTVTSPTSFTYACTAAAATLSGFSVKPVVGQVGAAFASTTLPIGTGNLACSLVVNGGLQIQSTGNMIGSNQSTAARMANLLTSERLAALTGTGGFLAPKPTDQALTIPNGWATTVPVALLVSHNVAVGSDILLGGTFNNNIVVGKTSADNLAQLDGGGQIFGGTELRGFGILTSRLFVANGSSVWPGAATVKTTPLTQDATLTVSDATANSSLDLIAGGRLKIIITTDATAGMHKQSLLFKGTFTGNFNTPLALGANSILSLGVGDGSYGAVDIPIVISDSNAPIITAKFGAVLGLPAGWKVVYQRFLADLVGDPSPTNQADTIVIRTTAAAVTPATIDAFVAKPEGAGVLLSWHTASEFKNAGFNVYRRAVDVSGEWERVNTALIAGRISNPDEKGYAFYDWAEAGRYDYKLETVSIAGAKEAFAEVAGPVVVDCANAADVASIDGMDAGVDALAQKLNVESTRLVKFKFGADTRDNSPEVRSGITYRMNFFTNDADVNSKGLSRVSEIAPREIPTFASDSVSTRSADRVPLDSAVASRFFASGSTGTARSFTAAKIIYDTPGVLKIPQVMLPAGFDIRHATLQREGRTLVPLALTDDALLVFGAGYQDDYTDKDALFLRKTSGPTSAGSVFRAQNLFDTAQPVNVDSPASVTVDYHDVYFDFNLRPYTFAPWFSSKYLSGGTTQSFDLEAPAASSGAATLTLNVWSLTQSSASPDHALQVLINGQPAGQSVWSGGGKMMQMSFDVPANALRTGNNLIALATPAIDGVDTQIALLHSMTLTYTRQLDGSAPVTVVNAGGAAKVFEVTNLPSSDAWVVDARFPDRAALVPYESRAQAGGTFALRFSALSGGSGRFLVVPVGQENLPLSVSKRQVKPAPVTAYLATGPSQFGPAVQPLLARRTKEGIRSTFIEQEQLFDYYNNGRYGPSGIQNAVRSVRPQYLLLLGRTTYDYRNYSGANVDPLCPAFLVSTSFWSQATSDSLFGDLGRGYPEVAVGRLPANTPDELSAAVSRILTYAGAPVSGVRVHAVADRTDPSVADFAAQAQELAQLSPDLAWQPNYLGGTYQSAAEVSAAMRTAANGGADWLIYIGHGNSVRLGKDDPRILQTDAQIDNVQEWTGNGVFLQATCTANWMAANKTGFRSIAMQALTQPQGGISASIGSSTYMRSDCAVEFMQRLMTTANKSGMRWGTALMQTQQWAATKDGVAGSGSYYGDLNRTEQIFGDPAMPVFMKGTRPAGQNSTPSNTPPGTSEGTF